MHSPRYSDMELKQWQDACAMQAETRHDASRHNGASATMAKGQAEKKQARSASATAAMQTQAAKTDDWASECLFDCYNG